ncbi:hypothetical protein [Winogradskyella bathintestinalis]|uniref:Competence protein n=1 Tax=Winogradskyella bathintestinalis TaxID=3035208 RepID=A0ABT7ZTQ5_9FLAO|nr:hypothetical protein [Winogradskyella bathintestinalis]MDN3492352.1 hypothetical protein [Winogradskyella bathintestinalis]
MSVFSDINNTTEKASHIGERYVKASHQYFKLKVFQQLTVSISLLAKVLAIGILLFAGLVFFSVAGAIELSNALDSYSLGFFLVGLIYILVSIIIYLMRAKFNPFIIKKLGPKFFD